MFSIAEYYLCFDGNKILLTYLLTHRHDLCMDSNNFEGWRVENVEIFWVFSPFDLETQGHTHFLYDQAYFGQYAIYWLDLDVDSKTLEVRILRKFILKYLTLMVDFDLQGQTNFSRICFIFKVSHLSYIICFWFSEFLDLDHVNHYTVKGEGKWPMTYFFACNFWTVKD